MEEMNGNQIPVPKLCDKDCGFYGSPNFDGLCSKCHRSMQSKQQQSPPSTSTDPSILSTADSGLIDGPAPVPASSPSSCLTATTSGANPSSPPLHLAQQDACSTSSNWLSIPGQASCFPAGTTTPNSNSFSSIDYDTGTQSSGLTSESDITTPSPALSSSAPPSSAGEESTPKKAKKNRCGICKKKLGLTGFECRCGGLFCSTHRYSDGHDCHFDYKAYGQEQIRKSNPVIIGDKVPKI